VRHGWSVSGERFQINRFLLIWAAFIFVFFSLSGSKLPAYILPVFPPLVLLLAPILGKAEPGTLQIHGLLLVVVWFVLALAAFVFGENSAARSSPEHYRAMATWLLAGSLVAGLLSAAAVRRAAMNRRTPTVTLIAAGSFAFLVCAMFGYQAYAPMRSSHELVKLLRPTLRSDTAVFSVNTYDQTFPFYLNRTVTLVAYADEFALGQRQEPEKYIPTIAEFAERWRRERHAIALMSHESYERAIGELRLPMQVIARTPRRILVEKR